MHLLKVPSITLAALGGISGLIAALYWLKASRQPNPPDWEGKNDRRPGVSFGEPPEFEDKAPAQINAIELNAQESARLNAIAALWTAGSVLLSAAAGVLGSLEP